MVDELMDGESERDKLGGRTGRCFLTISAEHLSLITSLCQYAIVVAFFLQQHERLRSGVERSRAVCILTVIAFMADMNGVGVVVLKLPYVCITAIQRMTSSIGDGRAVGRRHHVVTEPDDVIRQVAAEVEGHIV